MDHPATASKSVTGASIAGLAIAFAIATLFFLPRSTHPAPLVTENSLEATAESTVDPTAETSTTVTPESTVEVTESVATEVQLTNLEAAGHRIYVGTSSRVGCQSCHGITGEGIGVNPDIRGMVAQDIEYAVQSVADMSVYSNLRAQDYDALEAYLAHLERTSP